jgi:hypothetical protein
VFCVSSLKAELLKSKLMLKFGDCYADFPGHGRVEGKVDAAAERDEDV